MKKILSFILAGVVALGLIGCSGVLHDMTAIDMSQLYLRGDMNNYGTTPLTAVGDGTYTVTFSATANPQSFGIATSDGSWTTCYRMEAAGSSTCVAYTEDEVASSTAKNLYTGGGMKNATIATTIGTDYTLTITPMSGYLSVSVKAGEAPKTCYAVVDNVATAMTLKSKGLYTYTVNAATTSTSVGIMYDGTSYGLATALSLDTATALTKGAKAPTFTTIAGKDYVITVDATADDRTVKMTATQDIFKCYIIGDIAGEFQQMTNLQDTKYRAWTFEYADTMTAWGGSAGKINFIVNDIAAWAGNKKIVDGIDFTVDGGWDTPAGNGSNCTATGLEVGKKYTILVDITDTTNLKAELISGPALFVTGAMDSWGWSLPVMENDTDGAYYTFTKDQTACEFKVKTVPNWVNDSDVVFLGATVTTTPVACGTTGNGTVTAVAGDKMYVYYDYSTSKWMAKLVH